MAPEPYDQWTVRHLHWAIFCGSFYVLVNFTGASRADAPTSHAFEIAGNNEAPSRQQTPPWCHLDRDAILDAFEWMVNTPVELSVGGFR